MQTQCCCHCRCDQRTTAEAADRSIQVGCHGRADVRAPGLVQAQLQLSHMNLSVAAIAGVIRGQLQKPQADLSKCAAMAGLMCASLGS